MKNKVVTIVSIILILLAIICFGYIFINSIGSGDIEKPREIEEGNKDDDNSDTNQTDKGQNVVVGSRLGVQLQNKIKYSNLFSELITKELDEKGISDKMKILTAINRIVSEEVYQDYIEYSPNYISSYVSEANVLKVVADTFDNQKIKEHSNVMNEGSYDAENHNYIIVPIRHPGESQNYTIEVPYKITKYSDRMELVAYRIYGTRITRMEDEENKIINYLYYDNTRSLVISSMQGEDIFNEFSQIEYIRNMIHEKSIDTTYVDKVVYVFGIEDDGMKLKEYKKDTSN